MFGQPGSALLRGMIHFLLEKLQPGPPHFSLLTSQFFLKTQFGDGPGSLAEVRGSECV